MPVHNIYSKREKRQKGEMPDVYQYAQIPQAFRVQAVHILRDVLGSSPNRNFRASYGYAVFKFIHDLLCREYGVFHLSPEAQRGFFDEAIYSFLLNTKETNEVLDVIETSFSVAKIKVDSNYRRQEETAQSPDDGMEELNKRFLEHGIGYQFEQGKIIRIDTKLTHEKIVKPTLHLLAEKIYSGANEEYMNAHEHYRHQRYKECMNDCLKAFESVMKAICKKRNWIFDNNDTAKRLLDICFEKNIVPSYLQGHFSSLRSSLESGVPTVRNKNSGHGQGVQLVVVPDYMASYLLNLTATSILLLANAEKKLPI
jgi:hypothetical protein